MAYIVKVCPKCKTPNQPYITHCAKCGAPLPILKQEIETPPVPAPAYAKPPPPPAPPPEQSSISPTAGPSGEAHAGLPEYTPPTPCRIVDIDMPFWSMVGFMVKWAVAAIPALVILAILATFALSLLAGFFGGLRSY